MNIMGISEVAVRYALQDVIRNGEPITPNRIAELCECTDKTVNKVFRHLIRIGDLERTGTPRGGYEYTYREHPQTE